MEKRERCKGPGSEGRQAKPPACKCLLGTMPRSWGALQSRRPGKGDMKKRREWGKTCFLQTWCDLSLKNLAFPSSARVYLQGSLCLSVSRPIIPLQSNPSVVTYSSALIYF